MKTETVELRENEQILRQQKGDTWKTPEMIMRKQVSGTFTFTNQRICFRTWGPFKSSAKYDIEYADIASIQDYSINVVIKTGIEITTKNQKTYKISVWKRNEVKELINSYILNS